MVNAPDTDSPKRALTAALVMLMLIMQAVIVLHYPVHLLEGLSQGQHLPGAPAHHGDDACPVCFVAKSLFSLVVSFAVLTVMQVAARFVYAPEILAPRRARHASSFRARGPPSFV